MVDAVQVLKPGWRALDANGDVYSSAVLHFFNAGTSNTRTVYSNYGLSTSLGTTVTCDSGGFPTSDGSTKVEIYTGNTPYKVTLKNSAGTTIWTLDNIIAALDTSSFLTDSDVAPDFPITNTSSNVGPVAADQGNFWNINCSGGDVTVTFPAASTLGNGWNAKFRHDGTANQILFIADGSELFKLPSSHAGVASFASTLRGQVFTITCDGTGYKVEQTGQALHNTVGVITIADRLSTPPSAEAGARYIVGSGPSGAWSTFAQHDIAEANGQGGWFKITPPTNSGWVAWVDDEKRHYNHDSTNGWRLLANGQAGLAFVTSGTISAASTLDLTIPSDADELEVVLWNIIPATDAQALWMRFSQSSSFLSAAADYQYAFVQATQASVSGISASDTKFILTGSLGTSTNERLTLSVRIFKPNAASTNKSILWSGSARQSDAAVYMYQGGGELIANANAIDGVRFLMASGNITSGSYTVMARRYS
jgi:hypothetical protein